MRNVSRYLFQTCATITALIIVCACSGATLFAESVEDYQVRTTKDVQIPKDELAIMVKPLTRQELEKEADAWFELVKAKARQVSSTEIAIKRKNKEIQAAEETASAVEKAQQAAEKAETSTDTVRAEEARQAAEQKAQEAAQKVVDASERSQQDEDVSDAVTQAEQQANTESPDQSTDDSESVQSEAVNEAAEIAKSGVSENKDDLEETKETVKRAAEASATQKTNLLDSVTKLRDERTELVDRARIVLTELDAKGGESKDYRDYLVSVSGVAMDVSDWDAFIAVIKGWATSDVGGIRWAWNFVSFFGTLLFFYLFSMVAGRIADGALRTRHTRKLTSLMRAFLSKMIRRTILFVGFVVALRQLEVDTAPLLAAIGAAGFVVAFALQDSLSNFASGIMILMYRPFDVGDVVETGGTAGKVISLNLVSVTISTFDNKTVMVPNNKVWNDIITNATGVKTRRVDMVFGISYDDDIAKTQEVLERIVHSHPLVLDDPEPTIRLNELADSSVNFICRPWSKTEDYWAVYWDVTRAVKEEFDKEGISIPYPQQDVYMHTVSSETPAPVTD